MVFGILKKRKKIGPGENQGEIGVASWFWTYGFFTKGMGGPSIDSPQNILITHTHVYAHRK